jgi:hypothetical protein
MNFFEWLHSNPYKDGLEGKIKTLEDLSDEELEAHLQISKYGNLQLTDAIRPNIDAVLKEGYKIDSYKDESEGTETPVIMAAASRDKIFDLFRELSDELGWEVDVVLESSHQSIHKNRHTDLYGEGMDNPVLQSTLIDYEDLLINDGCTGIAVVNPETPAEVQFDEHKLLIIYAEQLRAYEKILRRFGIRQDQSMKFITEDQHVHSSSDEYFEQFRELALKLTGDRGDDELRNLSLSQ